MPRWVPEELWLGREAVIIGGGPSLAAFPFECLKRELTIGCNAAYSLGSEISSIVVFGDSSFFAEHEEGLREYGGAVFTNCRKLLDSPIPWLRTMPRLERGLGKNALGWNGNTGAGAINLAFLLGVQKVFLLGFDMKRQEKKANWHELYEASKRRGRARPLPNPYDRFLLGFDAVKRDWERKFADREIINVNDDSSLVHFPILSVSDFLKEREYGGESDTG